MKNVLFITTLILAGTAFGQTEEPRERKSPEERAEMMTKKMKKNLDLTDEQANQVKEQNLLFFQKQEEQRAKMEALREEGKAMREEHKSALKTILTPEQAAKAEELMEERKEKRKKRIKRRRK